MAPSSFSLKTLFDAWKQAEIRVEIAEKRWAVVLHESSVTPEEKSKRRRDLLEARSTAKALFKEIFDATTAESPANWQSMPRIFQSSGSAGNRPDD